MAQTIANRIFKPQIPNIFLKYNGLIRVLDTPKGAKLDLGIKEIERDSVSQLGIAVIVARQITEQKPKVEVQFSGLTEEVWEILTGNLWQDSASVSSYYGRNRFGTGKTTIADDTTGFEGYGVVADAVGLASVFRNGKSVALTQQGFSGFTGSTPLTYAVGNNGAMRFSDDTLDEQKTWRVPQTLTNVREASATRVTNVELGFTLLDSSLFVYRFFASSVQPIADGVSVDFAADSQSVSFQIQYDGSTCSPYTFTATGRQVTC
jgi:hypothetical protein